MESQRLLRHEVRAEAPSFEDHLRCESAPANETPTTISRAQENVGDRLGRGVYKDRGRRRPEAVRNRGVRILLFFAAGNGLFTTLPHERQLGRKLYTSLYSFASMQ